MRKYIKQEWFRQAEGSVGYRKDEWDGEKGILPNKLRKFLHRLLINVPQTEKYNNSTLDCLKENRVITNHDFILNFTFIFK